MHVAFIQELMATTALGAGEPPDAYRPFRTDDEHFGQLPTLSATLLCGVAGPVP